VEGTRFDVFCHNLKGNEGLELFEILQALNFTFCYALPDGLLAFWEGGYSRAFRAVRILEDHGFIWLEDVAILGLSEKEERELLRGGKVAKA